MESDREEFKKWLSDNDIPEDVVPSMGRGHGPHGHGMRGEE